MVYPTLNAVTATTITSRMNSSMVHPARGPAKPIGKPLIVVVVIVVVIEHERQLVFVQVVFWIAPFDMMVDVTVKVVRFVQHVVLVTRLVFVTVEAG
jgi:hypothetical protein